MIFTFTGTFFVGSNPMFFAGVFHNEGERIVGEAFDKYGGFSRLRDVCFDSYYGITGFTMEYASSHAGSMIMPTRVFELTHNSEDGIRVGRYNSLCPDEKIDGVFSCRIVSASEVYFNKEKVEFLLFGDKNMEIPNKKRDLAMAS